MFNAKRLASVLGLLSLFPLNLHAAGNRAVDPFTSEFERSPPDPGFIARQRFQQIANEQQERFRLRVPIPDAVGPIETPPPSNPAPVESAQNLVPVETAFMEALAGLLCVGLGLVLVRKFAPDLLDSVYSLANPLRLSPASAADSEPELLADAKPFSEFLNIFRGGPQKEQPAEVPAAQTEDAPTLARDAAQLNREALLEFFAQAQDRTAHLKELLEEVRGCEKESQRQEVLTELAGQTRALKGMAGMPELLPAWQMACALEWLIKQLAENSKKVTASTLRTISGGLELLADLCHPGVRPDLCTEPPLRLLAVDDDAISRQALFLALKKGLNQPDLAQDGESALLLAEHQPYDVIFLDVQMPGMDGFELCTRIHELESSRSTPVVFVTVLNDFDARARSTLCGGNELLCKPFLAFELTVKALTLALRNRLQAHHEPSGALAESSVTVSQEQLPSPETPESEPPAPAADQPVQPASPGQPAVGELPEPAVNDMPEPAMDTPEIVTPPASQTRPVEIDPEPEPEQEPTETPYEDKEENELEPAEAAPEVPQPSAPTISASGETAGAFLARAFPHLGGLKNVARQVSLSEDPAVSQELLVDLYLGINALSPPAELPELRPLSQVIGALDSLLKKLISEPKNATPSTLRTTETAIDLLHDLCSGHLHSREALVAPLRLLVVDDDPVARRAMVNALQMEFTQPENVADGEAALALARKKEFDVVFLDVQMPGMDGFTVCPKLHETKPNSRTPVVFVTAQTDLRARTQSKLSGGHDFITKPFLRVELTLKALTLAWRERLQKAKVAQAGLHAESEAEAARREAERRDRIRERRLQARSHKAAKRAERPEFWTALDKANRNETEGRGRKW